MRQALLLLSSVIFAAATPSPAPASIRGIPVGLPSGVVDSQVACAQGYNTCGDGNVAWVGNPNPGQNYQTQLSDQLLTSLYSTGHYTASGTRVPSYSGPTVDTPYVTAGGYLNSAGVVTSGLSGAPVGSLQNYVTSNPLAPNAVTPSASNAYLPSSAAFFQANNFPGSTTAANSLTSAGFGYSSQLGSPLSTATISSGNSPLSYPFGSSALSSYSPFATAPVSSFGGSAFNTPFASSAFSPASSYSPFTSAAYSPYTSPFSSSPFLGSGSTSPYSPYTPAASFSPYTSPFSSAASYSPYTPAASYSPYTAASYSPFSSAASYSPYTSAAAYSPFSSYSPLTSSAAYSPLSSASYSPLSSNSFNSFPSQSTSSWNNAYTPTAFGPGPAQNVPSIVGQRQ